ncbi:cytochrome P450 [Streptomyces sp. NPDC090442]|uniref:cytochrome P450 n=1 Tax=Streptomyces sp. NPDC090442 TaxID=3365962 RepID=UPI00381C2EB4
MTDQGAPSNSLFYSRDGFGPGPRLIAAQRDDPIRRARDFYLFRTGDYWLVTRHADVRRVLADPETFGMHDPDRARVLPYELINMDAPDHTRLRRVLTSEFTARRVRRLLPSIARKVDDLLDAMESRGAPADLMKDFALPLPAWVVCELLGVPYTDREEFQRRSREALNLERPLEERLAASRESHAYMASLVAEKRQNPDDQLIGMVIREHGDKVSDAELTGVSDLLLLAGHETTSNMIGLGALLLLEHPEQAERLRTAAEDDPVVDTAVEELLRYLSVSSVPMARTARTDTELGGVEIKAGEQVLCNLPVANRDPALGADMDRFDIERAPAPHVTFGHGVHHCIGAPLARAELRIAIRNLLRRFPNLRATQPVRDMPFRTDEEVYGLYALPVTW